MTLDEMWERLVQHQSFADANGYGPEWAQMCEERTAEAAWVAADALDSVVPSITSDASQAAWVACCAVSSCRWSATGAAAAIQWIEKAEGKNNDT
jgi:hypothetical protein